MVVRRSLALCSSACWCVRTEGSSEPVCCIRRSGPTGVSRGVRPWRWTRGSHCAPPYGGPPVTELPFQFSPQWVKHQAELQGGQFFIQVYSYVFTSEVVTELVGSLPGAGMIIQPEGQCSGLSSRAWDLGAVGWEALGVENLCNSHQRTRPICADWLSVQTGFPSQRQRGCLWAPGATIVFLAGAVLEGQVTTGMELEGGSQ